MENGSVQYVFDLSQRMVFNVKFPKCSGETCPGMGPKAWVFFDDAGTPSDADMKNERCGPLPNPK